MTTNLVDNFEYTVLTKIHGSLDHPQITRLIKETRANAASVHSELGGGANGHLGLVEDPVKYAIVSQIPYVRHIHPPPLNIPVGASQHAATRMLLEHKEARSNLKEMIQLEKLIQKKIGIAVLDMYMKPFRNRHSNAITTAIPVIFSTLLQHYGKVSAEDLLETEQKLRDKVFDISEPLIVMYNEIEDLLELSTAAGQTYTQSQIVNLGVHLIKNTNDFEKGLNDWYDKPIIDHNWLNFQDHFTWAQQNLRRVRGPSMQSSIMINQANAISQSLMRNMQDEKDVFMDAVEASETRILKAFATITPSPPRDDDSTGSAATNKTANDLMMIEILKLLKDLRDDKDDNKRKHPSNGQPRGRHNNQNSNNNNQQRKNINVMIRRNTAVLMDHAVMLVKIVKRKETVIKSMQPFKI